MMVDSDFDNADDKPERSRRGVSSYLASLNSYTLKSTSAFGEEMIFVLFILAFVVARFFGILIHEVGHGLTAIALGGDFFAFYASPGTGVSYIYTESIPDGYLILVGIGGVIAQVIVGMIIFFVYKANRGFAARLFSLQLLLVLLVYPFLYLGLSVFLGGDGSLIVAEIQRMSGFDVSIVLAVSCIIVMVFFAHLVSIRIMSFLKDHFSMITRKETFLKFFMFLSLPLLAGFAGAVVAAGIIQIASIEFFIAFLLVAHVLFFAESVYLTRKSRHGHEVKKKSRAVSGLESNIVVSSFVAVILIWAAVFGPTPSTANGVILNDPPLEAEKYFEDRVAMNIDVRFGQDKVEVDIISRGIQEEYSQLERTMWHTYDDRTHWPSQENRSLIAASSAFAVNGWRIISREIGEEVYGFDGYYENPRIVRLVADLDDVLKNSNGKYTMTVYDPWLNEPTGPEENFLHRLNITWSAEFALLNYSSEPLKAPRSDLTSYIEWKNQDLLMAPAMYVLEFSRT
jgi:hypothetical protein